MKTLSRSVALFLLAAGAALAGPDDRKIEEAAKASYNYRTVLENHVRIRVHDGFAVLTGAVEDADQKTLAEDTVKSLPGVKGVDNRIRVEATSVEHSDAWIAWKIRAMLLVKANVSATNTKVAVVDGVVILTGTAVNPAQSELTELYAKEVEGVKSVRNRLAVRQGNVASADDRSGDAMDDASITAQVTSTLASHHSTSTLKPKVLTINGAVVLTGTVTSEEEKALVSKLAGGVRGVKSVTNNMAVGS